ncbi:phosphoribosylanthranilate isomerase [Gordonia sp. PS3]|uniref:N-(5'-phosphoribosyl)anthranilate isomerase n=3 Tax=Gordoniaceae TaxID=85026 RepID=L7LPS5_9ACTN|nr:MULTISPECIES: phosphoribosylanthranilate isomerase [Gordonia]MBY4570321.1 phosphoribosylanthranilate isomerase [Gordonia sihwensis]WFN94906.1 phosphoribosylanthranilate isomerase [Gordonia sihwensis]GAC62142.1 N-(5'-phosphoribosyl)anthranilate isomerase [Gordonia sihwensis NBRC 108236]
MDGMYVKVCGLTSEDAVGAAVSAGADAIGVVMNETSPRAVDRDRARAVVRAGRSAGGPGLDIVLVVNDKPAVDAAALAVDLGFDVLQLHGRRYGEADFRAAAEGIGRIWRATSLVHEPPLTVGAYGEERLLLDAPKPGSGERWDLSMLTDRGLSGQWLLAGGLTPDNVADAIAQAHPWGVDVSSGVESAPGVKDLAAISRFVEAAKSRR